MLLLLHLGTTWQLITHNPYGEDGATGYFRWVDIGNRDGNVDDYNQDYLTGLRGTISALNDATWEVYYHHNIADNKSIGEYYLSYSGLTHIMRLMVLISALKPVSII